MGMAKHLVAFKKRSPLPWRERVRVRGKLLFLLLCLFSSTSLFASLQSQLNAFHSMTANFTQTLSAHGQTQTTQGKLWLQKPDQFRWQVAKPHQQLYISNGKTLWDYDANLMQVIVRPLGKTLSQTPLKLLSGQAEHLGQQFKVIALSHGQYQLIPKQSGALIKTITLQFHYGKLSKLSFENATGQVSVIRLSDVQLNSKISSALFQFTIPKGVDVLS